MSRYTHDDMPFLRQTRDEYRQAIEKVNGWKALESSLKMLIAYATVVDTLQDAFDGLGRELTRLEKTAPGAGQSPASPKGASMRPRRASSPVAKGPSIATALRASLQPSSSSCRPLSAAAAALSMPWRDPLPAYDARRRPEAAVDLSIFSGPFGQVLPADRPANHTQTQEGGNFHVRKSSHNAYIRLRFSHAVWCCLTRHRKGKNQHRRSTC